MANNCDKYGISITNYVLGEKLNVPEKELMSHLKKCKKCRDELVHWQNTYAIMVTQEHHAKPATQRKIKSLLARIKKQDRKRSARIKPVPGARVVNKELEFGGIAAEVWQHLYKNGKIKVTDLPKKTKRPPHEAYVAMGWLAKADKVDIEKTKQISYVYLTEEERRYYQRRM